MKKLLVSLLCAVMMVTFMPSMAFAVVDGETATSEAGAEAVGTSLPEAKEGVVTLTESVKLTSTYDVTENLTINLNGYNITAENLRAIHVKSGTLTIKGKGTITSDNKGESGFSASSSVIRVGDDSATKEAGLVIGADVKIASNHCYGVTVFGTKKATITVNGTVAVTGENSAISGNGRSNLAETDITIGNTANISAANSVAIYHPQKGDLNVNGGTITGTGGIEMKSGTLTTTGNPVIKATGTENHVANGDGPSTSGYAISIVENKNYKGTPTANLSTGTYTGPVRIESDNAESAESAKKGSLSVTGGAYTDLAGAVKYATEGSTIGIADDIVVSDKTLPITINKNVNIVGNGHKITSNATAADKLTKPVFSLTNEKTLTLNSVNVDGVHTSSSIVAFNNNSHLKTEGTVAFTNNTATTVLASGGSPANSVTVDGTLKISNNTANGMNGGTLNISDNDKVIVENNTENGITAKVIATKNAEIKATGNGYRGVTLNGGSDINGSATVVAEGNNTKNTNFASDIQISTNKADSALANVKVNENAKITAGTLTGFIQSKVENGQAVANTESDATTREKTLLVGNGGTSSNVVIIVKEESKSVVSGNNNDTAALFKEENTKNGVVIVEKEGTVHGTVSGTIDLPADVTVTIPKNANASGAKLNAPAGTVVKNESKNNVNVVTPNGAVTVKPNDTVTSYPVYIPSTPTKQEPVVEYDKAAAKVELSGYGTIATITVLEGYELVDVTLNGKSLGKKTTVTDLKTGDKLVVTTVKKPAEFDVAAALDSLKLTARSSRTSKKNIKVVVKEDDQLKAAVEELKANGYTVKYKFYRSVKKASKYQAKLTKDTAAYTNTAGKKGTMYYYKARLQVFNAAGEFVDQTELKQCKYANRLWTK